MPNDEPKWVVSTPTRGLKSGFLELFASRAILFALVKRDLKSRYRTSFFGFAWAFAKPVMQLTVYVLVIGGILGANRSITNFSVFIFCGLMFWNFFAECVTVGSFSIIASAGLVTKISFPREILPVASVLIAGVNLLIQMPVLIAGFIVTNTVPDFSSIVYVIPLLFSLFFLALAFALVLSGLNVYARDIQPLSELFVMLFMYLCPVIYSWTFVHDAILQKYADLRIFRIYELNPLTQILSGIQDFFWNGTRTFSDGTLAPKYMGSNLSTLWLGTAATLSLAVVAYRLFLKLEPNFAREL